MLWVRRRWHLLRLEGDISRAPMPALRDRLKEVEREIKASRSGYFDIIRFRAPQALMMHTQVLVFWALWRVSGLMLLGMALMKLGVFTAQLSNRFYVVLTVLASRTVYISE